jgi:hypothetical protein
MGLVYLAEQREPLARRVALKLIKPGLDPREVLARFRLGQAQVARDALEKLRAEVKQPDNGNNEEQRGFLREAEAVATGAGARPAAPEAART